MSHRLRRFVLFAIGFSITASVTAISQPSALDEYRLKAAYIYKFTKFVSWPAAVFGGERSPLKICISGPMPESAVIQELQTQFTQGHPLQVLAVQDVDSPSDCHVLYFRGKNRKEARDILQEVKNHPILTIGEYKSFARDDGIIEFKINQSRRVELIINQERARKLEILISAQLLEIASVLRRA